MAKAKVLVVEDDVNLLSGIYDILKLEGYEVLTAINGTEGLKVLQTQPVPPDLIISDITMPLMDGFTFLEHVRANDAWVKVPFIFLTAKSERHDHHKGSLMGADVYLTKPFEAPDLIVTVEALLKRNRDIQRVTETEVTDVKRKIMTILNHEFRTPLTLVVAYAEMLKEFDPEKMSPEEVINFLKGVNSGADRLRRLVENFIMIVELEDAQENNTFAWRFRLLEGPHWRYLVEDAHRQIAMTDIRPRNFLFDIAPNLPTIFCDTVSVTVLLRELMDNAAKFSSKNSTITVRVLPAEGGVLVRVEDEGRGIPANELENIWKPFYQIEREHYEDQGAGSGLAIVAAVAKLHNGSYFVESTEGVGSVFSVFLPIGATHQDKIT